MSADSVAERRWRLYVLLTALICVVCDGWSGKPSPLIHQYLLLPLSACFAWGLWVLLGMRRRESDDAGSIGAPLRWWLCVLLGSEILSAVMMLAEAHHFAAFGYHLTRKSAIGSLIVVVSAWWWALRRGSPRRIFAAILATYAAGVALSIRCFPLDYLRSDMLPVIGWANTRLLEGLDPYGTMHVGTRLYDFPYLPGVLVAFLPASALHLDLRDATLAYLLLAAVLIFSAARLDRRFEVAVVTGVFLLCPFLQYRHELYLQPHWFTLALAVVLMQRRRFAWAAVAWGLSCAIYQLSWILMPFFLLNALRRRGYLEVAKLTSISALSALIVVGPFLRSATHQIASNTVGQWSRLPHALADPMNLSYWLTFLVRPDELKWIQLVVLVGLFGFCWFQNRCSSLIDTLRWMSWALAVFIPLNIIVDGYFYLTLLFLVLLYVCAANGWWAEPTLACDPA